MSIEESYLTLVVEHYRRPHNQRALAAPTHVHEGVNPLCGDRVRVEVEVRDGAVLDAAFAASACAIATASASLLTDTCEEAQSPTRCAWTKIRWWRPSAPACRRRGAAARSCRCGCCARRSDSGRDRGSAACRGTQRAVRW